MKTMFHLASAVFLSLSVNAKGADLVEMSVPVPPVYDEPQIGLWEGPYVGIHVGYGWTQGIFGTCVCGSDDEDFLGGRIGAFAGRNWTVSSGYVVGVEADVNYDWNKRPLYGARVGTGFSGSARVRAGYAFGDVLLYAAGGSTATNAYVKDPDDSEVAHGWTIGLGIDWAATNSTFIRMEYRYNNFSPVYLAGLRSDFDQDVISIGIANRF
ncbi:MULTISPECIES: outer membrane protein [unclassified Neorhizobium]|uniref:outer membrane protein n=1 Tax=unclassified Neorhizobium TaxID=2629175 RepID=UPI001FF4C3B2|nr:MULTISPECIES: outer membrane beta-barrel protein [unclassified Neorhizobium]MCJ9672005.1 outer membrane beta-barrel protein [Neorhizobium sp. SHOUNA12B]MCJ9747953.1 outer membrane beta-barrel protein [Neorhizobium sp. SHOUNA12A]